MADIEYEIVNARNLFKYWIGERYAIKERRREGDPKPWSVDPVFQSVYFCNVRREDDRVTQFIRDQYSRYVSHSLFEYNIVLSRFLNWPNTLAYIGFQDEHMPDRLRGQLKDLAKKGKIWGGAYVITTHGIKMDKVDYLVDLVLKYTHMKVSSFRIQRSFDMQTLSLWADMFQEIDGIGSFLAGQVVADLKNTVGHPCGRAEDWWDFAVPGPGSIRGLNWFHYGSADGFCTASNFQKHFSQTREWIDDNYPTGVPRICNQDLQNCLCEYDKYMRVSTKTGRSKRKYEGV